MDKNYPCLHNCLPTVMNILQRSEGTRLIIAIDYDRTLTFSHPPEPGLLKRLGSVSRRIDAFLVLNTGRVLEDVLRSRELIQTFDVIVGENGAILYFSRFGSKVRLFERAKWLEDLIKGSDLPATFGEVIVSLDRRYEGRLLELLDVRVNEVSLKYNVDSIMILPNGCDKGSSLLKASAIAGIEGRRRIVAIGDGENDLDLFNVADVKVAVGNAVSLLKEKADVVLSEKDGEAVIHFLEELEREWVVKASDRRTELY